MLWGDKPFHSLDFFLQQRFGEKIVKLCLDGGFSCPNRDGTLDTAGCIFCDETGSGDFAGKRGDGLDEQAETQRRLLGTKWAHRRFLAYFQNFSATHAPVVKLQQIFSEALALPDCVGLAIATRPDCLDAEKITLLKSLYQQAYLWVELGLQTKHEASARFLNRGYALPVFEKTFAALRAAEIPIVVHVILGIPGETRNDMMHTLDYLSALGVDGLKLHLLHIHKGTRLAEIYQAERFPLFEETEYIELVADLIERLPPSIVLHRITGDGTRGKLLAPLWSLAKKRVYTGILGELRKRGSWQGCKTARPILASVRQIPE